MGRVDWLTESGGEVSQKYYDANVRLRGGSGLVCGCCGSFIEPGEHARLEITTDIPIVRNVMVCERCVPAGGDYSGVVGILERHALEIWERFSFLLPDEYHYSYRFNRHGFRDRIEELREKYSAE